MKSLVIVPTYNEKENIQAVIERLRALRIQSDILIIDDNSPDGTAQIVRNLQQKFENIHLLERPEKSGLGTAYVMGFQWALERDYEYILEMDADLSHNPDDVPRLIEECESGYDLVVGSRYCKGVNVINWPMKRLLLSYFANFYTQFITRMPLKDATAGFKCIRRNVLESINLSRVKSSGYSFQIEMDFRAWDLGFKVTEIPIVFVERTEGKSKMSRNIVWEAIFMVWKLKFLSLMRMLH